MNIRMSVVGLALLALAGMAAGGCFSGKVDREATVHVKGTLTNGGKPITVPEAMAQQTFGRPMVRFVRVETPDQPGASVTAVTAPDGSFEADVPLGTYRIGVQHPYAVAQEKELIGKFDVRSSPIERTITGDGQELHVDLSNPTGS